MATLFRRIRHGRKGHYYSRVMVPRDLSAILKRREIVHCLGTTHYRDALVLAAHWQAHIATLFTHLRRHHHRMTVQDIHRLVQEYISKSLEEGEDERHERMPKISDDERDSIISALGDMLESAHGELLRGDVKGVTAVADDLLASHSLMLAHDSPAYRRLCTELVKAHQIVFKTEMERWAGNYYEPHTAAYSVQHSAAPTISTTRQSFTPSLSFPDAVKIYFSHHEKAWAPRTAAKKRNILERFLEIVSKDRPGLTVKDLSRVDCVAYRDVLQRLPNNMRSKSVWQALKGKQVGPRISPNTVNQCLEHVGHMFTWLKDEGKYMGDNPASRLQLKGIDDEENRYEPFTKDELQRLFNSSFAAELPDHPDHFFIPLIGLYAGMRLGEIAQPGIADIVKLEDMWIFEVRPDKSLGRRLKTKASRRRVPIHPHLVKLGLLHYWKEMKAAGQVDMFPELKAGKDRGRGDAVGKWFTRYRRDCGIIGDKKVFHSFRHGVQTRLRGIVPDTVCALLLGHKTTATMTDHYTHQLYIELKPLRYGIEKLDFSEPLSGLIQHLSRSGRLYSLVSTRP
jgi:integrase